MEGAGDAPDGGGGGSIHPADTHMDDDGDDVEPLGESPRAADRALVGGEGGDFVAQTLSTAEDVGEAIRRVQQVGGMQDTAEAEPLLGLLGQLGMTRAEVYRSVLNDATESLLARVKSGAMKQGALLSLLDASFRYVAIEELRAIPLAVLERLNPVPSSYLKNISADIELFRRLPVEVQRQCWELRPTLLRRHAAPVAAAFADEIATVVRNLECDVALAPLNRGEDWSVYAPGAEPPSSDASAPGAPRAAPGLPRKSLRAASASVQRLRGIVGASKALYLQVVGVMRAHYAEHGDPSMCALRSQLLMACHDAELTDLCASDRCHRLAWLADACVRDACLDGRRVSEMCAIVKQLDFDSRAGEREAAKAREKEAKKAKKEAMQKTGGSGTRSKGLPALKVTFGMKKKPVEPADGAGEEKRAPPTSHTEPTTSPTSLGLARVGPAPRSVKKSDELDASGGAPVTREDSDAPAGSMSRAEAGFSAGARENRNPLAGVGMILRDPPVTHLLLHETCRTLEETVRAELVPKREKRLKDLTDLLAVALESRKTVRDARPSLPAAPAAAMSEFYPILAEMLLESQAREAEGDLGEEEEEEAVTAPAETRGPDADAARDDGEAEDGEIADVSADDPKPKRNVDADTDDPSGRVATLARLMRSSDVIRKVALTHALRRARAGDTRGARPILAAAAAGGAPDPADEAPFAVTLARRLCYLYGASHSFGKAPKGPGAKAASVGDGSRRPTSLASRPLGASLARPTEPSARDPNATRQAAHHSERRFPLNPNGAFWRVAVEGVLVPMCVAGVEAHEETLRLILAAAPALEAGALASVVERTLHVTRKSRKLHKKQVKKPPGYEHEPPTGARGVASSLRGGLGSRRSFGSFGSASALHESSRLGNVSGTSAGGASLAFRTSAGHVSDAGADTDGVGSPTGGSLGGADGGGVRAAYQLLAQREGARLDAASAPRLHEYLARRDRRDPRRRGAQGGPTRENGDGDEPSGEFRTFSPALTG
jgi:negative elongation factor B